jgi:hypothetical protein
MPQDFFAFSRPEQNIAADSIAPCSRMSKAKQHRNCEQTNRTSGDCFAGKLLVNL